MGTWKLLERLKESCDVSLTSDLDEARHLRWRMTIRHRQLADAPTLKTEAPDIAAAVRQGLAQAIEAKWMPD